MLSNICDVSDCTYIVEICEYEYTNHYTVEWVTNRRATFQTKYCDASEWMFRVGRMQWQTACRPTRAIGLVETDGADAGRPSCGRQGWLAGQESPETLVFLVLLVFSRKTKGLAGQESPETWVFLGINTIKSPKFELSPSPRCPQSFEQLYPHPHPHLGFLFP